MQVLENRGLRLLTIDNGGLQAISVLLVLSRVCEELSRKAGHSAPLAPYQIFDIIAGVGTGGWLAILLGRYRLTIQQCMTVYFTIANAIDPGRRKSESGRERDCKFVLDQALLIHQIRKVVKEYGIGETMLDTKTSEPGADPHKCHAFAIGVLKGAVNGSAQQYHLFRTYKATASSLYAGPQPETCTVWDACAATTAASYLCDDYMIDGTVYWDAGFPHTHNVSEIALDEASAIFGPRYPKPDFVLSLSPGIPNRREIKDLKKVAQRHNSTTRRVARRLNSLHRVLTGDRATEVATSAPKPHTSPARNLLTSTAIGETGGIVRAGTDSSVSSVEGEQAHQDRIKQRLRLDFHDDSLYLRLQLGGDRSTHKPYLDDIAKPGQAEASVAAFLGQSDTLNRLKQLVSKYTLSAEEQQRLQSSQISSRGSLDIISSSTAMDSDLAYDRPDYGRIVISNARTTFLGNLNVHHSSQSFNLRPEIEQLPSRYVASAPDLRYGSSQIPQPPETRSRRLSNYARLDSNNSASFGSIFEALQISSASDEPVFATITRQESAKTDASTRTSAEMTSTVPATNVSSFHALATA